MKCLFTILQAIGTISSGNLSEEEIRARLFALYGAPYVAASALAYPISLPGQYNYLLLFKVLIKSNTHLRYTITIYWFK